MTSSHQTATRRGTNRAPGVEVTEANALRRHSIEIVGPNKLLTVATQIAVSQVIRQNKYYVRLAGPSPGRSRFENRDTQAQNNHRKQEHCYFPRTCRG